MKLFVFMLVSLSGLSLLPAKKAEKTVFKCCNPKLVTRAKPTLDNKTILSPVAFCEQDPSAAPSVAKLGNINGEFSKPAFIDYVKDNDNYYGFMVNNWPGKLLRLDFGNSLLNKPSITDLGTVNGTIPNNTEGLQIVKENDHWFVILVGGDPSGGEPSAIVKIDFGNDLSNPSPKGENWSNLGEMNYPHDLEIFEENGKWYGVTANTWGNSITRFDFGNSIANKPIAENLGGFNVLKSPTGLCVKRINNELHVFITNANGNSITRLDFGNSILNEASDQTFHLDDTPWDIQIIESCQEYVAFVLTEKKKLIRLNLGDQVSNLPQKTIPYKVRDILDFPHSISKPFIEGNDLHFFVPDANYNTLNRFRLTGIARNNFSNENL